MRINLYKNNELVWYRYINWYKSYISEKTWSLRNQLVIPYSNLRLEYPEYIKSFLENRYPTSIINVASSDNVTIKFTNDEDESDFIFYGPLLEIDWIR
jgi:hypothetical protein